MNKKIFWLLFSLILLLFIFLRFYQFEIRNPFGWDQVDNAWAAKNILIDHKLLLTGMQAKLNSGIFIGPAYYYLIAPFYWLFNLDPIASGIFAGLTSLLTFFVIYHIIKKLFSQQVALIAILIQTVSLSVIKFDRVQWPVNFIPPVSLIIFYSLYQIMIGREKYLIPLSLALGFSFHVHFTAIFYPIIIFLSLPFFPWTKKLPKYGLMVLPLFLVWFIPNILATLSSKSIHAGNMANYLSTYYHGVHLTRIFQLTKDAFIQFEEILTFSVLKPLKYLLLPLFALIYILKERSKQNFILCYLMALWFLVPWLVFSTYSGEISDYYFSLTRPIVIVIIAYLVYHLFNVKFVLVKILTLIFLSFYTYLNISDFFSVKPPYGLDDNKKYVKEIIKSGGKIEFEEGNLDSYLFYIYTRK